MDKKRTLDSLAKRFVNYQELSQIPCIDNGDDMMDVKNFDLTPTLEYSQLEPSTGNKLFLRTTVCKKLIEAQQQLDTLKPRYRLGLVYAYRSLSIQKERFQKMKQELGFGNRTDPEAMEKTHHFIAVPEFAGHPTGGAIDLLILDQNNMPLDFGTPMHALEQNSYAYSPFISDQASINRKLLRMIMTTQDFAPYDGEWWHFSYGEQEWAAYYNERKSLYTQLDYNDGKFFSS